VASWQAWSTGHHGQLDHFSALSSGLLCYLWLYYSTSLVRRRVFTVMPLSQPITLQLHQMPQRHRHGPLLQSLLGPGCLELGHVIETSPILLTKDLFPRAGAGRSSKCLLQHARPISASSTSDRCRQPFRPQFRDCGAALTTRDKHAAPCSYSPTSSPLTLFRPPTLLDHSTAQCATSLTN